MALSAADRQRRWRDKRRAEGFVPVTVLVPPATVPGIHLLAEALRVNRDLEPGPLRDAASGRLVSANTALRGAAER